MFYQTEIEFEDCIRCRSVNTQDLDFTKRDETTISIPTFECQKEERKRNQKAIVSYEQRISTFQYQKVEKIKKKESHNLVSTIRTTSDLPSLPSLPPSFLPSSFLLHPSLLLSLHRDLSLVKQPSHRPLNRYRHHHRRYRSRECQTINRAAWRACRHHRRPRRRFSKTRSGLLDRGGQSPCRGPLCEMRVARGGGR